MLRRRGAAITAALLMAAPVSGNAYAANDPQPGTGSADCTMFSCRVEADEPGSSGPGHQANTGGSHSSGGKGRTSPVTCTYKKATPQPPTGSPDWEGHKPGDGAVYEQTCRYKNSADFSIVRMVWAADPPKGGVDPAVLAKRAVNKMWLRSPDIGIVPKAGGKGLVGLPVWMWTTKGPETYGPNTATASTGAVTVTATAKVSQIVWDMGDGHQVTCTTAGTPYKASYGKQSSPDCGYRYHRSSKDEPGKKYPVTATATWSIDWRGGGQSGQLTQTRQSQTQVSIGQLKVLN